MTSIPEWLHNEVADYFASPLDIQPETVLDIGANIGAFAMRAHREWPAAKVLCYEPMPFNVDQLRRNVSSDWCEVVPCAVRQTAGVDDMFIGDMFVTGSFTQGARQTSNKIHVQCVAADAIPSCAVVKIDTEGSEVEILQTLRLDQTQVVMLEHHSKADAQTIKHMLAPRFKLVHDESEREVGTMIFVR